MGANGVTSRIDQFYHEKIYPCYPKKPPTKFPMDDTTEFQIEPINGSFWYYKQYRETPDGHLIIKDKL